GVKGGAVGPVEREVIEMPPRPGTAPCSAESPPASSRPFQASATDSQMSRVILYALLMGLGACLLVVVVAFEGAPRLGDWLRRRNVTTKDQQYLSLTRDDGYHEAVRKLGPPDREQWITPGSAEIHLLALWYTDRSYIVVLMGAERQGGRYIGTIHTASRAPLDAVPLPGGGTAAAMLRNL